MKKINSLKDLCQYVSEYSLKDFQHKLYGYDNFEDMVVAYTNEFLKFLKSEQGFQWGDDLEDLDLQDEDERCILRTIDKA